MISKQELFLFITTIILFYIMTQVNNSLLKKFKINIHVTTLATGLLFTTLLIILHKSLNIQKDSFTFEVTPQKKCCSGLYMLQNDPKALEYCKNLPAEELAQYCCDGHAGFNGAPVHFQYTSMSDDKWQNKTCNCPGKGMLNDPCVL